MKVILLENVEGVGRIGETKDVRDGYGRNFLVPRGLALPATKGNLKRIQNQAAGLIKIIDASPLFRNAGFSVIARTGSAELFRIHAEREGRR